MHKHQSLKAEGDMLSNAHLPRKRTSRAHVAVVLGLALMLGVVLRSILESHKLQPGHVHGSSQLDISSQTIPKSAASSFKVFQTGKHIFYRDAGVQMRCMTATGIAHFCWLEYTCFLKMRIASGTQCYKHP